MYTNIHSNVTDNNKKVEKKNLISKWINNMFYIHAMEYYSSVKEMKHGKTSYLHRSEDLILLRWQ